MAGTAMTAPVASVEEAEEDAGGLPSVQHAWGEDDVSMSPPAGTPPVAEEEEEEEVAAGSRPATPPREAAAGDRGVQSTPLSPVGMSSYGRDVQYYVGQWLDVKDTVAQWLEATVMEVDSENRRMFIHYNGWPVRWDEWIEFESNRVAPFRSVTRHNNQHGLTSPSPLTQVQNAPRVGPSVFRLVLPELARMMRQIQPIVEEASDIVTGAVEEGGISVPQEWGWPHAAGAGAGGSGSSGREGGRGAEAGDMPGAVLDGRMRWHSLSGPAMRARARASRTGSGSNTGASELPAPGAATTVATTVGTYAAAAAAAAAVAAGEEEEAELVPEMGTESPDATLRAEQRARLTELGDQLAPLFDRFGRVLMDMSSHLRRASDSQMYDSGGTYVDDVNGLTTGAATPGAGAGAWRRVPPCQSATTFLRSAPSVAPSLNARNTVGTALSTLGPHGSIMDVHLIVSPNPLGTTRATGTT